MSIINWDHLEIKPKFQQPTPNKEAVDKLVKELDQEIAEAVGIPEIEPNIGQGAIG